MKIAEAESKMDKSFDYLKDQLRGISSLGIRSAALIETLKADCYGNRTEIRHIAQINKTDNGVLLEPYDNSTLKAIETACTQAGYSAYAFSKNLVKVNLPTMTGEELEQIKKRIKKLSEEAKISIRNVRKNTRHGFDKETEKEDDKKLQTITDKYIELINELVQEKFKNIDDRKQI